VEAKIRQEKKDRIKFILNTVKPRPLGWGYKAFFLGLAVVSFVCIGVSDIITGGLREYLLL
jgi:hypothetical protein